MSTALQPLTTTEIPVNQIYPNSYNPNRMTEEEFAELVAEVRHLGRLPKPVVVRTRMIMLADSADQVTQGANGFEIVDGEHNWRAAKEVGLSEIPCEVIEADDFESMRQTYKRNQHGTHNPLLLGKIFQQMMADRNLSRRKLAEAMDISEGTVRNALEYVQADEVRNSYAAKNSDRVRNSYAPSIDSLSLRQARVQLASPETGERLAQRRSGPEVPLRR